MNTLNNALERMRNIHRKHRQRKQPQPPPPGYYHLPVCSLPSPPTSKHNNYASIPLPPLREALVPPIQPYSPVAYNPLASPPPPPSRIAEEERPLAPFRIHDLPAELILTIYEYAVKQDYPILINIQPHELHRNLTRNLNKPDNDYNKEVARTFSNLNATTDLSLPALALVSRAVRQDALKVYFASNIFLASVCELCTNRLPKLTAWLSHVACISDFDFPTIVCGGSEAGGYAIRNLVIRNVCPVNSMQFEKDIGCFKDQVERSRWTTSVTFVEGGTDGVVWRTGLRQGGDPWWWKVMEDSGEEQEEADVVSLH